MINLVISVLVIVIGVFFYRLRPMDMEKRKNILFYLSLATCLLYVIYVVVEAQYKQEVFGVSTPECIVRSLPLHLCYICLVSLAIGIRTNQRVLLSFCYYTTALGAILAILFPDPRFNDRGFLAPSFFLFFMLHASIAILGIALGSTGLYSPRYADIPKVAIFSILICVVVHIVNLVVVWSGFTTNFMYTMSASGNVGLKLFYEILPIPLLYLITPVGLIVVIMVIQTFLYNLVTKRSKEKRKASGAFPKK